MRATLARNSVQSIAAMAWHARLNLPMSSMPQRRRLAVETGTAEAGSSAAGERNFQSGARPISRNIEERRRLVSMELIIGLSPVPVPLRPCCAG